MVLLLKFHVHFGRQSLLLRAPSCHTAFHLSNQLYRRLNYFTTLHNIIECADEWQNRRLTPNQLNIYTIVNNKGFIVSAIVDIVDNKSIHRVHLHSTHNKLPHRSLNGELNPLSRPIMSAKIKHFFFFVASSTQFCISLSYSWICFVFVWKHANHDKSISSGEPSHIRASIPLQHTENIQCARIWRVCFVRVCAPYWWLETHILFLFRSLRSKWDITPSFVCIRHANESKSLLSGWLCTFEVGMSKMVHHRGLTLFSGSMHDASCKLFPVFCFSPTRTKWWRQRMREYRRRKKNNLAALAVGTLTIYTRTLY